jgi:hypothetical protein
MSFSHILVTRGGDIGSVLRGGSFKTTRVGGSGHSGLCTSIGTVREGLVCGPNHR